MKHRTKYFIKIALGFTLAFSGTVFAGCKSGYITSLALEPNAGYMNADYKGTARFTVKASDSDQNPGYVIITEALQDFDRLYSTVLTAKTSNTKIEVCWDDNAGINAYRRMRAIILK